MPWNATGGNIQGPEGPVGAQGSQGSQGVAGAQGPTGPQGPAGPSVWGGIGGSLSSQTDLAQALALKLNASKVTVGPTPPASPAPGDLWIDTN